MSVHITKTYNIGGLIGLRQNAVKNAGETLGFKEMSLFKFPDAYDSDDELHVRMDGIIASLCPEDIVIFQHPSGESPRYDGFLFEHLRRYHGTKIVAFIQEIAFDRDDSEYSLSDEITLLNRADMFIFASAALRDYYIANGLKEKPYLIQNIPDYMTDICANEHKNKKLYIMAETSQNEYPLNNLNIEVVQYDEYRAMESIEGDNSSAKVMDRTRERARIFFTEPTHRRQVKIVDWLDDAGQVRLSEHYNRYGAIFCHTVFNKKGQKALRKFFDVTGREMIVENFVTGDILVRWQDKDWIFRSKTDFIAFFIRCSGLEDTAVYFNSLSYPFFASQALAPNGFRDALFWHEPVGDEIPGNMQIILHDQGTRAKRVFVSRRESYDRLIALGAPSDKVKQLGYIYSFVRENKHRPHILVCTNSENVGHLTELASLMPQMHFHVAAITEMSSKLMSAGQYDNVSLYPNVKMSVLDSLFEKCDFYLDINHEGEIVDAVHRAFLNNMLIVGYEETMHNAYYTADTNTFKESEYADMAEALNLTLAMPHLIDEALAMQKKAAVAADATDYMEILHL